MGALTGFAHGTAAAKDPHAQGTLRLQENIIEYVLLICSPCEQPLFVETYCISGIKHQCEVESSIPSVMQGHAAGGAEGCVSLHKCSQTKSGRASGVQRTAGVRPAHLVMWCLLSKFQVI